MTSLGTFGHTYPLIPLACAARDAGHDVVYATSGDFVPEVRKAGLHTVAAGAGLRETFGEALAGETRQRAEIPHEELAPIIATVFGDLLPRRFVADLGPLITEHQPDLVIYEAGNPGGAFAAKLAGVPAAAHAFGRTSPSAISDVMRQRISDCATEIGIAETGMPSFGDPYIDICPESVQDEQFMATANRIPLRPVGWNEPGALPAGVKDREPGRPLIYLTLGTAMGSADVLKAAIAGLSVLDADILVAAGPTVEIAALGEVASNVQLEAWVPQADLLPHVDLVVHHGGSGTTLGAFSAGLPQLLLPQGADQFINADVVVKQGVGDRLLGEEVTADTVTSKARRLLADDSVKSAVRTLAAEVAEMPPPAEVVEKLPSLIS